MTKSNESRPSWLMRNPSVAVSILAGFVVVANLAAQQWHTEQLAPELKRVNDSIGKLRHQDWVMAEYLLHRDAHQTAIISAMARSTGVEVDGLPEELKLSIKRVRKIYAGRMSDG